MTTTRLHSAFRRLDYLPPRAAVALGIIVGIVVGYVLIAGTAHAAAVAMAAVFLVGAVLLARSGEAIAVLDPVTRPDTPAVESVTQTARVSTTATTQPITIETDRLPDGSTFEMVVLRGGTFTMGSTDDDPMAYDDEKPAHPVTVGDFAIGKLVVTQSLYRAVTEANPGDPKGDDMPINNVSWFDAVRFCNTLSERMGCAPCYRGSDEAGYSWDPTADGYRLPTEAEWEYAARAGTSTSWSFGDDEAVLSDYAWYNANSDGRPHPTGLKRPNPWGLHDVHGNVYEWCWDAHEPYEVSDVPAENPAVSSGAVRVLRGGSFFDGPRFLRSAGRIWDEPEYSSQFIGFRCVRAPRRQH